MKNKVLAILMTALLLGSTLIGCNQKYDEVATKQENTMKKQNKAESNTKKENKDSLVPAAKKDSKAEKEDSTKKEKNNPKESADKKENIEQKQEKANRTETAKSESKPTETSKPSSKPTENKKPSNNSTSKPTPKPETKPQNNSTPKPQHTHSWVPQTHDEYHDAITHKETVVIEEAWDEEVFAGYWECCNVCGADITNDPYTHDKTHAMAGEGGGWHTEVKWETKHHPAVTEEKVVVDEEAWTETVVDGYKCSCGATK